MGLSKISYGQLKVVELFPNGENYVLKGTQPGYTAELHVVNPEFYRNTILYGEVGFGEAFVADNWRSPNLNVTLRWFAQNAQHLPGFSGSSVSKYAMNSLGFIYRIKHFIRPNTLRVSRKNISEHYDLGNSFYELMLGKTMAYSSGIYYNANNSLDDAQENKFEVLCKKLQLNSEDNLLEIGSGWGGFAIYAAKKYKCRITTVTISKQQFDYVSAKIIAEKLESLIEVRFADYRTLKGSYSKIVSIEMLEAVGIENLDTFFGVCNRLLQKDGLIALQYITYPEAKYEQYLKNNDFIQIHIFPGSCLLSNLEVLKSVHRTGDLMLVDLESIGQHYATTLRQWRLNIEKEESQILKMGYSDEFLRKWIYYLTYCEAGFAQRAISDVQIVFSRANSTKSADFHEPKLIYRDNLQHTIEG
ncbi:MAG TPA: cyclopropane-fatty-acyl-phospholipid synthase family protein [Turneriella sp.]|nr:cyclopropane-fatty-acyl-phospholipid synthase family protein [Turneriella sp.]